MEAEKAEDIEEVKGRTSSRMGIAGAAKFARRGLRNGTRNFNLKDGFWMRGQERSYRCIFRKCGKERG